MLQRLFLPLALAVLVIGGLAPHRVSAASQKVHAMEIDGNVRLDGVTGNCTCQDQWYAAGLRRGTVDISAKLKTFDGKIAPAYSIQVWLMHGSEALTSDKVGCSTSAARCGQSIHFHYKIRHHSRYYVLVRGEGASTIKYAITVVGRIYPLHCGFNC